jgi:hypothetical protein
MPHHMEDLEHQIPYSWGRLEVKFPGYARGGMLKFRIDRYISDWIVVFTETYHAGT